MSILRTGIILAGAIMLLPVDDRKQSEFTAAASSSAERTASFCSRNPSTCDAGRDLWALFVRKAEYGVELGARLVREQLLATGSEAGSTGQRQRPSLPANGNQPNGLALPPLPLAPGQPAHVRPASVVPVRPDVQPAPRAGYPMDNPSRWR